MSLLEQLHYLQDSNEAPDTDRYESTDNWNNPKLRSYPFKMKWGKQIPGMIFYNQSRSWQRKWGTHFNAYNICITL